MSDKITIPAVAYAAMVAQFDEAVAEHQRLQDRLHKTLTWQHAAAAADDVNRLQAQLDRFAPEEQQDAQSQDSTPAADDTLAGSGGAREPAIPPDDANYPTLARTIATIDRDDPGPIPDCLKRGAS